MPPAILCSIFFAGSGTTGAAAAELGRDFLLVDNNPAAVFTMAKRLGRLDGVEFEGFDARPYLAEAVQPALLSE